MSVSSPRAALVYSNGTSSPSVSTSLLSASQPLLSSPVFDDGTARPQPSSSSSLPLLTTSAVIRELRLYSTDKAATTLASALSTLTLHPSTIMPPLASLPPAVAPDVATLLSLLYSVQHSPPPSILPSTLHQHAMTLFLLSLSFYLHQAVLRVLLQLLSSLQPHIRYWEEIDAAPHNIFAAINREITAVVQLKLRRAPSTSFAHDAPSSSPASSSSLAATSPSHKLRRLLRLRKSWTTRVGRLAYRAHRLRYWLTLPHSAATLPPFLSLCLRYSSSLYLYVAGHQPNSPPASVATCLPLLEDSILGLEELSEWFQQQLQPLKKPSHLQRHWLRYISLSVAAAVGGELLYRHRARIAAYTVNTYSSLSRFSQEHLLEPLANIYTSVFSTFHNRSMLASAAENLRQSQDVLTGMLADYGKQRGVPEREVASMAAAQDMTVIMDDYRRDMQHPWRSLLLGDLLRQFLIQVQQVKVSGEAAMVTMDQLLSANNINFNILATIPAVIAGLLLVYTVRDVVVRVVMRGSDLTSVFEAVRRRMREVETVCIQYLYHAEAAGEPRLQHCLVLEQWQEREEMRERGEEDQADDSDELLDRQEEAAERSELQSCTEPAVLAVSVCYLPPWAHGQILLHLHSLPAMHMLLDSAERVGWGRALALLCNPALTPNQKVLNIAQMQRSFDFLSQMEHWIAVDDAV